MGGISSGGGHGGKKSVDQEIPLVPFIDLLLCCVMFLLVTAVWNQLARIEANQQVSSASSDANEEPPPETEKFYLQVTGTGFTLASSGGSNPQNIPKSGEDYDTSTLATKLAELKTGHPNRADIIVSPDDDVSYRHVVAAMDTARGAGWTKITLQPTPAL